MDRGDWQATVYGIAIFEHNVATKSKHQVLVAAHGNLGSLHSKRGVSATGPPEKSLIPGLLLPSHVFPGL